MSEVPMLDGVISQGGDDIYDQLEVTNSTFESRLTEWMSFHGLDRTDNPLLVVSRQAAFNILLKSALYSHYRLDSYELDALEGDTDLREHFTEAKSVTDSNAFDEYILDEVAHSANSETLQEIIKARHLLVNADDPAEEIGRIFEQIILQDSRRKLGQFRTPEHVAEVLANWAITHGTDTVLDPGMGAGALTAKAYEHKQNLPGEVSVYEMYGVDVNRLAVVMSATALKLINGEGSPNLYSQDFIDIDYPGATEHISTTSTPIPHQFDAIVSNPPYSRHHELSEEDKAWINQKVGEEAGGLSLSGRSPMYLYFFLHATQFLKIGGRMAFLTPSEFLETNYGSLLKQYLLSNFEIEAVILHDNDSLTFEDVKTTSCITLLKRKENPNPEHKTKFLELDEWPDATELLEVIQNGSSKSVDFGNLQVVEQGQLDPDGKWTQYFDPNPIMSFPDLKPLEEIGSLKRGIATGSNDYFCLTDDEVEEWGIEEEYLSPLIRNSTSIKDYDCTEADFESWRETGDETWLLYHVDKETISTGGDGVQSYLQHGVAKGADKSTLAESRNIWYRVDRRKSADVWATYMTQNGFRFIHNKIDARNLNNLHSIYFEDYSDREIRSILAYLNSTVVDQIIAQSGRTYAKGLQKIEPNELKGVPIIDPHELAEEHVTHLSELFERLCDAARKDDDEKEEVMDEIDEYLADILNSREENRTIVEPKMGSIQ